MSHDSLSALPPEILQEIAWLSFNPNIYFVSWSIRWRLYRLRDYLNDLSLLIFVDRARQSSAWYACTSLPWLTVQARRWNFDPANFGHIQRRTLQREVLGLESITASRLVSMLRSVLRSWISQHVPVFQNIQTNQDCQLQIYLTTAESAYRGFKVEDMLGNILFLNSNSVVRAVKPGNDQVLKGFIIDMQAPPTRLLRAEKGSDGEELGKMLLHRTHMDSLNHSIVKKYLATAKPKWMQT